MTNFALADALGIAVACVVFPALCFFPGYLFGQLFNPWQFRSRTFAFQIAASIPLSLGIGPVITFFLGSFTNWPVVWLFYVIASIAALCVLFRSPIRMTRDVRIAFFVGVGWSVFAGFWLMDWQFSSRVYFPIYAFDYGTRAEFVHSLAAFGLPAQSPVFNPGHPVALHYHFLWLLQCALVHWQAPVLIPARVALIAGAIWCGLGLMSVTALAMRLILDRRSWIALVMLAATGLDLIPRFLQLLATRMHLTGLLHTAIWEPHYICALVACMVGLMLLSKSEHAAMSIPAALCFATAVGSGSFVALVFAIFLAVWMLADRRNSWRLALSGGLTVLFSLPYLLTLRAPAQNVGGGSLLAFSASPFSTPDTPVLFQLLELPLHYLLEFGFFAACVWVGYRRKLSRAECMLLVMATVSLVICTFVESRATPNNDLGWRGFLVSQFALLLLSAAYFESTSRPAILKLLLFLGLASNGYDMAVNRIFPILSDWKPAPKPAWLGNDQRLGDRTAANREAYAWLQRHSLMTATIGQNPDVDEIDVFSSLYADRRIVAGDRTCTIGFGGTAAECAALRTPLSALYAGAADYSAVCQLLPADFYLVKDTDPIWRRSQSWAWIRLPVFANQFVRIFDCSRSSYSAK